MFYPSIISLKQKQVTLAKEIVPVEEEWIASEKVHGANLSFVVDLKTNSISVQSRNKVLGTEKDEISFFKCGPFIKSIIPTIQKLSVRAQELLETTLSHPVVLIYGELAGGAYNHKKVARDPTSTNIQGGSLHYAPFNFYYIFDIALIDGKEEQVKSNIKWLPITTLVNLVTTVVQEQNEKRILPLVIDFQGTLADCLAFSSKEKATLTRLPSLFQLPEIETNMKEGFVIRPVHCYYYGNGERIVLKDKNPSFLETIHKPKDKKQPTEINITLHRIESVMAKLGYTMKDAADKNCRVVIADAVAQDFIQEMEQEEEVGDIPKVKNVQHAAFKLLSQTVEEALKK